MTLIQFPFIWPDPERVGFVFYDDEIGLPPVDARGHRQVARPMIEVVPDHPDDCWLCAEASTRGELTTVE